MPCGGTPDIYDLERALRAKPGTPTEQRTLRSVHRVLRHIQYVELPRLRDDANDGADRNVDLRLQYLLNRIDQQEWQRKLQQREKRRERAFAAVQVYDMFVNAAGDLFRELVGGSMDNATCLHHLEALRGFADETLDRISAQFNMRVKRLRDD